jgi:hypothetical protein
MTKAQIHSQEHLRSNRSDDLTIIDPRLTGR